MFKNNAPFRSWISKFNSAMIDTAEDLDIVMSIYKLLECSQNCSMTSGSYRVKIDYYRVKLL